MKKEAIFVKSLEVQPRTKVDMEEFKKQKERLLMWQMEQERLDEAEFPEK